MEAVAEQQPVQVPDQSPEAKAEREHRALARKSILQQHGITATDKARVLATEKGLRPAPKTYLPQTFHDAHREEFIDGGSRVIATATLKKYGPAQADGTSFIFPTKAFEDMLAEAGGNRARLEDILGLPRDQLGAAPSPASMSKSPAASTSASPVAMRLAPTTSGSLAPVFPPAALKASLTSRTPQKTPGHTRRWTYEATIPMNLIPFKVWKDKRFSIDQDLDSGKHYLAFPVFNGNVEYEEYYEILPDELEHLLEDESALLALVEKSRRRENDDRLLFQPGRSPC